MKLGQNICFNDILDKLKNGSRLLKNMASRGRGIYPRMAKHNLVSSQKVTFIVHCL